MVAIPVEFRTLLEKVKDPEIPVLSVLDMGVIRRVEGDRSHIEIDVTPTYSGCPAMDTIEKDVRNIFLKEGFDNVVVKRVIHPAWTTDWMSEDGKRKLQETGIAPPISSADKQALLGNSVELHCPYCKSENTRLISQFGSTACKALYQCDGCGQPFDYFKCI